MNIEKTISLSAWLERATPEQEAQLYDLADTSYCATWQVANGRRGMSVEKAAQLERATIAINQASPTLPPVLRTSTCAVCAACPFAANGGAK